MKVLFERDGLQIECDGKTLWVNGLHGAIGRFSPRGVDVHNHENNACIGCGPVPDWEGFVEEMQKHHGIDVSPYKSALTWLLPAKHLPPARVSPEPGTEYLSAYYNED
jgi:hypothetical protein